MPTQVAVRPATPADVDDVAHVHLSARSSAPMPPSMHDESEVRAWLAGRLERDEVWVADVGGRVVAYVRFTETWLDDLYVAPTHAGRGVGSVLLTLAMSRRPDGFCLWVFETNAPARAFYTRRGLVELERTDGSANQERSPDVRMAWPGREPGAFWQRLLAEVDADLLDLHARRAALARVVAEPARPAVGPGAG